MAHELFDIGGGLAVNCNPNGRFHGWLFRAHHDGEYIAMRKLNIIVPWTDGFSRMMANGILPDLQEQRDVMAALTTLKGR